MKKLTSYINRPPKSHDEYPNSKFVYNYLLKFYKFVEEVNKKKFF